MATTVKFEHDPATRRGKTERAFAAQYAAHREAIARLVDVLEMHLEMNDAAHADAPGDWTIVGSLGKVREDLVNIVGFISNMDPETVEEFLDNAV